MRERLWRVFTSIRITIESYYPLHKTCMKNIGSLNRKMLGFIFMNLLKGKMEVCYLY